MIKPEIFELKSIKNNKGVLLLEVLISVVIISTILIMINRAFSISLRAVRRAGDSMIANFVLEDKLFDLQIADLFVDKVSTDSVDLDGQRVFYTIDISDPPSSGSENEYLEELPLKLAKLNVGFSDDDTGRFSVWTYVWADEE